MKINIKNTNANKYLVNDYNNAIMQLLEVANNLGQAKADIKDLLSKHEAAVMVQEDIKKEAEEIAKNIKKVEKKMAEYGSILSKIEQSSPDYEEIKSLLTEQAVEFGNLKQSYSQEVIRLKESCKLVEKSSLELEDAIDKREENKKLLNSAMHNLMLKSKRLEGKTGIDLFEEFIKEYVAFSVNNYESQDIEINLTIQIAEAESAEEKF